MAYLNGYTCGIRTTVRVWHKSRHKFIHTYAIERGHLYIEYSLNVSIAYWRQPSSKHLLFPSSCQNVLWYAASLYSSCMLGACKYLHLSLQQCTLSVCSLHSPWVTHMLSSAGSGGMCSLSISGGDPKNTNGRQNALITFAWNKKQTPVRWV